MDIRSVSLGWVKVVANLEVGVGVDLDTRRPSERDGALSNSYR